MRMRTVIKHTKEVSGNIVALMMVERGKADALCKRMGLITSVLV